MSALEDTIERVLKQEGYIVYKRKNHCDILAVKPNGSLGYLVECKDFKLSKKEQKHAVRQLNRNYVYALELLIKDKMWTNTDFIIRVLVAKKFSHQSRNIRQYTPKEFIAHILSLPVTKK